MKRKFIHLFTCLSLFTSGLLLLATPALAVDVAGINVPDQITQGNSNQTLTLNGAGIRSKFFFSIYVGALYLPETKHKADEILSLNGPNRVSMHFLYDEVSKEKLVAGWTEGFEENNSTAEMQTLKQRLDNFNSLFKNTVKGDVIVLDYLPDTGTVVMHNNESQGTIPGADFNRALLKVWLGDEPADDDLKEAMLGEDRN